LLSAEGTPALRLPLPWEEVTLHRADERAVGGQSGRDAIGTERAAEALPTDGVGLAEEFSHLTSRLVPAVTDLFRDYGISVHPCPVGAPPGPRDDGKPLGAIMGYSHERVRGALVLLASESTVRAWRVAYDGNPHGDLCDTIGEFSNMLLGRFKAGLLEAGLPILLATPTTAVALQLGQPPPGVMAERLEFEANPGPFSVRLEARFDSGFRWPIPAAAEPAAAAGEMMLF
jgi:hypothetical protein